VGNTLGDLVDNGFSVAMSVIHVGSFVNSELSSPEVGASDPADLPRNLEGRLDG
jgi:hypothetical protein